MKLHLLLTVASTFMLQACTKESMVSTGLDSSAESVRLVSYYTDGDKDRKTVGDWMLIHTGEVLQVQRNAIHPDQSAITSNWTDKFLPLTQGPALSGQWELRLDRTNGIVCLGSNCAHLYAICPSSAQISKGNLCHVFRSR